MDHSPPAIVTEESGERRTAFLPECVTRDRGRLLIACNIRHWQFEPLPPLLDRISRQGEDGGRPAPDCGRAGSMPILHSSVALPDGINSCYRLLAFCHQR